MRRRLYVSTYIPPSIYKKLIFAAALTETQVRKELAEEEGRRLAAGGVTHHATNASMFITLALDLEETQ